MGFEVRFAKKIRKFEACLQILQQQLSFTIWLRKGVECHSGILNTFLNGMQFGDSEDSTVIWLDLKANR